MLLNLLFLLFLALLGVFIKLTALFLNKDGLWTKMYSFEKQKKINIFIVKQFFTIRNSLPRSFLFSSLKNSCFIIFILLYYFSNYYYYLVKKRKCIYIYIYTYLALFYAVYKLTRILNCGNVNFFKLVYAINFKEKKHI